EDLLVSYVITYLVIDEVHILILATAASFRRRGIAQMLLRCLLEYLKRQGVVQAYLEVRSSNQAAIQLYSKLGFTIQGIRKNYYQYGNEDAVVMGCSLKTSESV
ncbi:ribosomal protein S18-alanine N-acetyltransferase, partial [candidate division KSB1 bacterium]|nr:ribosomal protein S18-alanine N-acetyltransferase [candidate division KSB1 bacterium]